MIGCLRYILIISLVLAAAGISPAAASTAITDLNGHWSAQHVHRLLAHDIVEPGAGRQFGPDQLITRGELVYMLIRALDHTEDARALSRAPRTFTDVSIMHPYRGYVEAASELGLAQGYPDGSFRPEQLVNRAEMAAFLVRALDKSDQAIAWRGRLLYSDRDQIPAWARGYVGVVQEHELIRGFEDGSYHPFSNATKAQLAVVVARLMERQGTMWSISGTVTSISRGHVHVRISPDRTSGLPLSDDVVWVRNEEFCDQSDIRKGDQIRVISGPDGVLYAETVWKDDTGQLIRVTDDGITFTTSAGIEHTAMVADGAMVMRNGSRAWVSDLAAGDRLYVVYDAFTGQIRVLDAVRVDVAGYVVSVDRDDRKVSIMESGGRQEQYVVATDAIIIVNGRTGLLSDLRAYYEVTAATVHSDRLVYLEVYHE